MTNPLRTALADAERRLDPAAQERLAALVTATVDGWVETGPFTAEELAYLRALDAEPDDPADPAEVAGFLAAHGAR
jgi:hypothetical protein